MNNSNPESETPEAMPRRKFLMCACGIVAAPLAVAIGYPLAASLAPAAAAGATAAQQIAAATKP